VLASSYGGDLRDDTWVSLFLWWWFKRRYLASSCCYIYRKWNKWD
jgi:hypothetical protein